MRPNPSRLKSAYGPEEQIFEDRVHANAVTRIDQDGLRFIVAVDERAETISIQERRDKPYKAKESALEKL